jgi:hypothetical protein
MFVSWRAAAARDPQAHSTTRVGASRASVPRPRTVVWATETSILGEIGWSLVLYGVAGLIGVILAGPTRVGRKVRGWIAPTLNEHQGYAWGAVAGIWLLLILWGGTHALRTWWGIVLIGALLAGGLVALRRETLIEAGLAPAKPAVAAK